jgi:hypothetical protein
MSSDIERWGPPNDSTAFEPLCLDLWKDNSLRDRCAPVPGRSGAEPSKCFRWECVRYPETIGLRHEWLQDDE